MSREGGPQRLGGPNQYTSTRDDIFSPRLHENDPTWFPNCQEIFVFRLVDQQNRNIFRVLCLIYERSGAEPEGGTPPNGWGVPPC